MKQVARAARVTGTREAAAPLLAQALEDVVGAALVLDVQLRIVGVTTEAERLLRVSVPLGIVAPKLLCGQARERPVAEALAAGRPVVAALPWPDGRGRERLLGLRATPIERAGKRQGWLLVLREQGAGESGSEQPVLFQGLWTADPAMKRLFQLIAKAAASDASVLVRGETGSGKELVAGAIHALSPARRARFEPSTAPRFRRTCWKASCSGTCAERSPGRCETTRGTFALADKGTLFLDEVAELPLELQAELLRVVETRTVIPVGGRDPVAVEYADRGRHPPRAPG